VPYLDRRNALSVSEFFTTTKRRTQPAAALVPVLLLTLNCFAQDQPQTSQPPNSPPSQTQAEIKIITVTIPAGTRIALVLTHPIQSRYMHRGDDIYAQITAPITMGNEVVIPPGTLVDGKVDKLERRGGRAELKLQSLSITFPDGYVAPVPGPAALESAEGYALTDPGSRRMVGMFALPAAGAGLGALIGHSIGKPQSEVSSNFPPGCIGAPPFCTSITTPVFGTQTKDAIIGAGIGGAIGAVSSMALLFSSHQFFLDVGSPVDMVLQKPVSLEEKQVQDAVLESEQHPLAEQPVAPRPRPLPPPTIPVDHGTCYTPGTPGTPPTVIPGPPGPDGIPRPSTIIPGTPPTSGTPYPCP
jgi:hypothetical protein